MNKTGELKNRCTPVFQLFIREVGKLGFPLENSVLHFHLNEFLLNPKLSSSPHSRSLRFSSSSSFSSCPSKRSRSSSSSWPTSRRPSSPPIAKGARFSTPADDGDCLERLTVVLNLDETLVCAYETSSLPGVIRTQAVEGGLEWFELECVSSNCDGESKINYVTVFERPGLREFLKEISAFSDLVLFTAGLEGYARPLVDRIDVENLFRDRLYRPSTVSSEESSSHSAAELDNERVLEPGAGSPMSDTDLPASCTAASCSH